MKFWASLLCVAALAAAQQPPKPDSAAEEKDLSRALGEAGSSQIDFVRALENHLAKYPDSAKKAEIERTLVRAAIEMKDDRRLILYAERMLDREPGDPPTLERVTRALLAADSKENSERALGYAKRYEQQVKALSEPSASHSNRTQWSEEFSRAMSRALVLEARATGNLGKKEEALALARRSYSEYPTAEGAREIGRWLMRLEQPEEAIQHFADAFTIADSRNTDAARAQDRIRMGELYRKIHASENGLGDLILEAYDRTAQLMAAQRLRLRESNPNAQAASPMDFTLPGVNGDQLKLAEQKGKTIVFDFWATWCGPCRAQHPLYEEVKQRFAGNQNVLFVSVATDEDRDL